MALEDLSVWDELLKLVYLETSAKDFGEGDLIGRIRQFKKLLHSYEGNDVLFNSPSGEAMATVLIAEEFGKLGLKSKPEHHSLIKGNVGYTPTNTFEELLLAEVLDVDDINNVPSWRQKIRRLLKEGEKHRKLPKPLLKLEN